MAYPFTTALTNALTSQKSLPPSPAWLSSFLSTQKPTTPLPALLHTAAFRILTSDIKAALSTTPSATHTFLPENVGDASVKEIRLAVVVVQVLDITDIGSSLSAQLEETEMVARGEARGSHRHEVVRAVTLPSTTSDEDDAPAGSKSRGPHKFLLQDARGTVVWGFEMEALGGGEMGIGIGGKMVLRGAVVARGCVLLEKGVVQVLGGKVEGWEREWKAGREGRLRREVEERKGRRERERGEG